ncbi:hypothetical protein XPR_3586 [Xanthomonas arboricola pv. pruni MAFF 301420]|uniref:Uncharacterized protein n=2 Tax=Xanthomonas arboricola pv. pruni TaxID=69929 RepID=W4SKC6_9XANT|nr:hypothetical protein XPU_1306 [Xanthomonas arboricola pv. pruni str. MAFF 311562]GAE56951.1 hypothetical protein XPR_3586 [Xanthomonas arboricola pv. pruni MAFF 301420]GAE62417.1 hypothetical protein XPN_4323 [Xanthomonas arboricola pv. pruni MAFF 301427]
MQQASLQARGRQRELHCIHRQRGRALGGAQAQQYSENMRHGDVRSGGLRLERPTAVLPANDAAQDCAIAGLDAAAGEKV